jgi:hypothetical protein
MLPDQFVVFYFKTAFDAAHITGFGDPRIIQWYGFDQVVADIHHEFHSGLNNYTKKVFF